MGKYKPELQQLNRLWRRMLYSKIVNIFTFENLPEEINEQATAVRNTLTQKENIQEIIDACIADIDVPLCCMIASHS